MNSTTTLTLNMQLPNYATVAYAVQGDSRTRQIVATLVDGSAPWTPPEGALAVVRYIKPDGTVGFYDTLEGGGAAVTNTGNVATITLAQQALAVPGDVIVQLNYYTAQAEKITAFNFRLLVQPEAVTDPTIVSADYFNVLTEALAEAIEAMEKLTLPVPIDNGGTGATTASDARTNLGLGNVANERQYSAENTPPYPVTSVNGDTGDVTVPTLPDPVPITNGGTGATTAAQAQVNLGLGSAAVENTVPIAKGGTGATAAAAARTNLGLGSVATESTVPISKGGTGATTAAGAFANLGVEDVYDSSTNGGHIKFPNGTLIQWGHVVLNVTNALKQIATSGTYAGPAQFSLPIAFANDKYFFTGTVQFDTGYVIPCTKQGATRDTVNVTIYDFYERPASTTAYKLAWYAVGRWK